MKTSNRLQSGKQCSAAQERAWGAFGSASRMWGSLTDQQMASWDAATKKENRRRHLRRGHRLNSSNLFTEINSHQAFLGLPPFLSPPERPALDLERLGPLMIEAGRHGVRLKLGVTEVPVGHVLVFGVRPCSPGRRYCDRFSYLGLLPAPVGGLSDITSLYYRRFGALRPGSRIIIFTQRQVDGWRGFLRRYDVVIPAGDELLALRKHRRTTAGAEEPQ